MEEAQDRADIAESQVNKLRAKSRDMGKVFLKSYLFKTSEYTQTKLKSPQYLTVIHLFIY